MACAGDGIPLVFGSDGRRMGILAFFLCMAVKMIRLLIRFFLPLSAHDLVDALIRETKLGLVNPCDFLYTIDHQEMFNKYYDVEIIEIYQNNSLYEILRESVEAACNSHCHSGRCGLVESARPCPWSRSGHHSC